MGGKHSLAQKLLVAILYLFAMAVLSCIVLPILALAAYFFLFPENELNGIVTMPPLVIRYIPALAVFICSIPFLWLQVVISSQFFKFWKTDEGTEVVKLHEDCTATSSDEQ